MYFICSTSIKWLNRNILDYLYITQRIVILIFPRLSAGGAYSKIDEKEAVLIQVHA